MKEVAMIGQGTLLWSGTSVDTTAVQAVTPGFAVVQINGPSRPGACSFAYGSISTIGTWFTVLGGTVGSFGAGWSPVMGYNRNSNCIPIAADTTWYFAASNDGRNQENSTVYVYWFPLGDAPDGGETAKVLSEADSADLEMPPPPEIGASSESGGSET
jgi:hypothetical protein